MIYFNYKKYKFPLILIIIIYVKYLTFFLSNYKYEINQIY